MRHGFTGLLSLSVFAACLVATEPLDALVRERVLTLPPDLPRAKTYPNGVVASGDLFKSGKRTAVAVAVADGRSLGLACFVHKNGDWREIARHALGEGETRLVADDGIPFTFSDLDGDTKPELLLIEQGGADDRIVRVFRFDAETDTLVAAGNGLRNPAWQEGTVRGQWKMGLTAGDIGAEEYRWVDGRLRLAWRSSQRYPMHEYLVGDGEPAVRVLLSLSDAAGTVTTTTAVGNLASYRNRLPSGEPPRPFRVLVREDKGRRLVEVTPKVDALRAANRQGQWDEVVSRAVFHDPAAFGSDLVVTLADRSTVKLAEVASVTVSPSTIAPTYQFLAISDEVRRAIEDPVAVPSLTLTNAGTTDWTRMDETARAWATAAASNPPLLASDDTVLLLRLPNISAYPSAQIEAGTLVSAVTLNERAVQLTVTMTVGAKPSLPPKTVVRPLIGVSLGRLGKGTYHIDATISGHPDGALSVKRTFSVP